MLPRGLRATRAVDCLPREQNRPGQPAVGDRGVNLPVHVDPGAQPGVRQHGDDGTRTSGGVTCVIAAYTAAVYSPYRVPALATLPVAALLYTQIREPAVPTVPDNAVPFLILIPIAIAADGLRRWKRRADEDRAQLSTLEREQAEALNRAAEHERARIARELHDVVTHNVSNDAMRVVLVADVVEVAPTREEAARRPSGRAAHHDTGSRHTKVAATSHTGPRA